MKIIQEGQIIKVFLNDIPKIDFKNMDELETYFRNLFLKLKKIFHITFTGLYNIDIYLDQYCGVVIELKKEDLEYIDYYDNEIDISAFHRSDHHALLEVFLQERINYEHRQCGKDYDSVFDHVRRIRLFYKSHHLFRRKAHAVRHGRFGKRTFRQYLTQKQLQREFVPVFEINHFHKVRIPAAHPIIQSHYNSNRL